MPKLSSPTFSVRSAVPGVADRLSAAPPTTTVRLSVLENNLEHFNEEDEGLLVMHEPAPRRRFGECEHLNKPAESRAKSLPCRRMVWQLRFETLQMPIDKRISLYSGILKLEVRVIRLGFRPAKDDSGHQQCTLLMELKKLTHLEREC